MRILMFGMSSFPGGIENYIANYFLCEEFSRDTKIDFVTYDGSLAYEDRIIALGHSVKRVPHLRKKPFAYMRAVKKLLKEGDYDCVYVNMLSAANIVPIRCAAKCGVEKIAVHAHASSTVKGALRRFLHWKNKRYCKKKATVKLACSDKAGQWLFDNDDFIVVPNSIDVDRFSFSANSRSYVRGTFEIADDTFVIGHIGRFAEEKNHLFLLDVFNEILKKNNDSRLLLVGGGAYEALIRNKADGLGISEKLIFAGVTDCAEKYYSAFDVFVFPSVFEGFGMSALEAQACGLPCFCSDTLSKNLDVTKTVEFIGLDRRAEHWADAVLEKKMLISRSDMNRIVRDSEYNIDTQIANLKSILSE
ncbi:MAG: glycosyltransferase [Clostridia bacterium]|nr:glycosyltransferase [Clostridia bacterium]